MSFRQEDEFGNILWYNELGQLHRENGPAVETVFGDNYYYYCNKEIKCSSLEEFHKIIKLKNFW